MDFETGEPFRSNEPTYVEPTFESSRIIVKNLPKRITAERIRTHFGVKGTITDVRLAETPDGRSRGFAFIGFSSNKEAKNAFKFFDRTFMDTSRIQVELAKPVGDPTLDRPWSRYSRGSSLYEQKNAEIKKSPSQEAAEKEKMRVEMEKKKKFLMSIYGEADGRVDAGLQRFMAAMKSKGKTKTWENDDDAFAGPAKDLQKKMPKKKKEPKVKIDVSAVPSRKAGAHGALVEQVHLKFEESSESEEEEDVNAYSKAFGDNSGSDEELYDEIELKDISGDEVEADDANIEAFSGDEQEKEKISYTPKDGEGQKADEKITAEPAKPELSPELIAENGRLFVRNLSYSCTEDDLRALFEPFGTLSEVHMPIARDTKKPKGFAYILFMIPEHALRAYSELDGIIFQGRLLHVLPSHEKPVKNVEEDGKKTAFQSKKDQELKELSGKDYNWNSLFIRPDTILDAIAAQLGVEKSKIMDSRSDSLATRLAVAETHLIQDTKTYLEAQGVCLDVFSGPGRKVRSDTIILVKNLPFDTDSKEIRKLFAKFGGLGRVILPPATKAIAMVEFLEASEARTAFKSLAYSKFKNVPLYLEWAPMASLKPLDPATSQAAEDEDKGPVVVSAIKAADVLEHAVEEDDTASTMNSNTLYLTNLNWSTPADTLKQVFSAAGPIKSVKLATKKRGAEILSLGFAFIEFDRRESLNRALDTLQGTVVDGHALVLKRSVAGTSKAAAPSKSKRTSEASAQESDNATKLIVRNVPFEATDKDLKELFRSFAQLKRVRLPRKFNGQHRGFAFLEFLSHAEAKNALETLSSTHLYGRHLVLEWAKEDAVGEEMEEEARSRAAARSITTIGGLPPKRTKASRVTIGDEEEPMYDN